MISVADYYQLDYSGAQVNEAIGKVLDEPSRENASYIIDLDSTELVPYNLDTLVKPGIYRCMYVDPACVPSDVANTHPCFIYVALVEGSSSDAGLRLTQTIPCGPYNYTRASENNGSSWLSWDYPKEIKAEEVLAMFSENGVSDDLIALISNQLASKSVVSVPSLHKTATTEAVAS